MADPFPRSEEPPPSTRSFEERLAAIGDATPVPSPCVNICRIDPVTSMCAGCRRTLDEIAAWSRFDDADKRRVWLQLPGRHPS